MRVLPIGFYDRRTKTVARELIGKKLRVKVGRGWRSGVIVETEAYVRNDPANHAFHGPNKRNRSMFKEAGTAYVYAMHQIYCLNAVTRHGEAVLIRSVFLLNHSNLRSDGPGRLCRTLGITRSKHDGKSLTGPDIQIVGNGSEVLRISVTRRIGVTKAKNKLLRFLATKNK